MRRRLRTASAGIVLCLLGATLFLNRVMNRGTECRNKVPTDVMTLEDACVRYTERHGGESPRSLAELVRPQARGEASLSATRIPLEPWGRAYRYEPADAEHPFVRIGTLGRDGLPGGEGDDADVDNETIRARIEAWTDSPDSGREE